MAETTLFIVETPIGRVPDEPAKVCEFSAIETAHTFRWSQQHHYEVGINLSGGRCDKERMTSDDGTKVYRTRAEAVEAYRSMLVQRVKDAKAELTRCEALVELDVEGEA